MSIPFFSFGRNVRSRTVSLSRTWTSRNTNAPDWLLWARRTPAEVTRPGTPTVASRDVERGMEEVDPSGLTEPVVKSQDQALKADQKDGHVPELGPAAMISDATAMSPSSKAPLTPLSASLQDDLSHVRIGHTPSRHGIVLTFTTQHAEPAQTSEKADVKAKSDAPVNVADVAHAHTGVQLPARGSASPTRATSPNASRALIAPASEGDDLAERTQPPSGAQTPSSPRAVRFPAGDELATYFARERGRARTSSGTQTPGKVVHFSGGSTLGSDPGRERGDGSTGAVDLGDVVGGDATVPGSQDQLPMLGRNAHFPAAQ